MTRVTANVLPRIARRVVGTARRGTTCTCGEDRVRWDLDERFAFIDHAPGCPLARLGRPPA